MRLLPTSAFAAIVAIVAFTVPKAQALTPDRNLQAPCVVQDVACRVVREKVERPFAPPVFREREECGGPYAMDIDDESCAVRRERVVRPDGSVVFRQVRHCP